jgi:hypothetical protein
MLRKFTLFIILSFAAVITANSQIVLRYGPNIDGGLGDASSVITPYVSFPAAFVVPYSGNKITKIRVGVNSDATNVYVYIKNKPTDSQYIYRQKIDKLTKGWNEITLTTPYDISGSSDIAIGYKGSFAASGGAGYSNEKFNDANTAYYNSQNKWVTITGSFCIQAIVEGDKLPQNEMLIGNIANQTAPYGETSMTFTGTLRNVGANAVNSYSMKWSVDGEEKTFDVSKSIDVNATDTFSIDVPSTVAGLHNIWAAIDKVNGSADSYLPNDTARFTLNVKSKSMMRRVVCEEFTGTWCGWCPRGLVGLELMKEAHPEQFIAISIHGNDKLEIDSTQTYNYRPFIESCSGAPMCDVDRKIYGDPYYDIKNLYKMETSTDNHIAYAMTAIWNADSTAVDVKSTYYSDVDVDAPSYNMVYSVTEDSITGYTQTNYYAGGGNGTLYGWENKADHTTDVVYNDLARAVYSNYYGETCRSEAMKAMEVCTYTYSVPVPSNVRDKKNIHIIGQLIDHKSGYILNAMSAVPLSQAAYDGIATLKTDNSDIAVSRLGNDIEIIASGKDATGLTATVFNATGMMVQQVNIVGGSARLNLSQRGLYIVKISKKNKSIRTLKLMY